MSVLMYEDLDGEQKEYEFKEEISLGSDEKAISLRSDPKQGRILLAEELGVSPLHAMILRSTLTRAPMLVNLAGPNTWVNDRPVVGIQILRQRDIIRLAQARLTLWEIWIISVKPGNSFIGKECQVCTDLFEVGDEVICCPDCEVPYHLTCWLLQSKCPNYRCTYSARATTIEALLTSVPFEFNLAEDSPLIEIRSEDNLIKQEGRKCAAGQRRDKVAFQTGNSIAYCPALECQTPYHFECWLKLEKCTVCGYNIKQLIQQVFSINHKQAKEEAQTDD